MEDKKCKLLTMEQESERYRTERLKKIYRGGIFRPGDVVTLSPNRLNPVERLQCDQKLGEIGEAILCKTKDGTIKSLGWDTVYRIMDIDMDMNGLVTLEEISYAKDKSTVYLHKSQFRTAVRPPATRSLNIRDLYGEYGRYIRDVYQITKTEKSMNGWPEYCLSELAGEETSYYEDEVFCMVLDAPDGIRALCSMSRREKPIILFTQEEYDIAVMCAALR